MRAVDHDPDFRDVSDGPSRRMPHTHAAFPPDTEYIPVAIRDRLAATF